jgi:hypothetical protein
MRLSALLILLAAMTILAGKVTVSAGKPSSDLPVTTNISDFNAAGVQYRL